MIAYGYLISWIPAEIIYSIEHGSWKDDFLLILAGGVACYICGLIKNVSAQYNYEQYDFLPLHYMKIFEKKMMHIRYEEIKKEKNKKDIDNSWSSAMYGRGVSDAINQFSDFFSYGLASIVYGIIICKLSFFILIVCIISMICSLKLLKIAREKHGIQFKNIGVYAKEADYLTHSSTDPIKGKDIRFFKYRTLFMKYYKNDLKNIHKIYATIHNWYTVRNVVDGFLSFVRNLLVYSILILEFYQGGLSLSQFVFYFGIVTSFTEGFETLCRAVMKFNSINSSISSIRDFLEIDDVRNDEQKISDEEFNKMKKKSISIKWDHVSFRYSEEADYIYKDLSFAIHEGEKIAIIGMNVDATFLCTTINTTNGQRP